MSPSPPAAAQPLTGSCLCGQITYALAPGAQPVHNVICHCGNCRKATGTHMFNSSVFRAGDFAITSPAAPKCYTDTKVASGNTLRRHFCGDCGSPIYCISATARGEGFVSVTAGTVDQLGRGGQAGGEERVGEEDGWEWVPDVVFFEEERPAFLEGIKIAEKKGEDL